MLSAAVATAYCAPSAKEPGIPREQSDPDHQSRSTSEVSAQQPPGYSPTAVAPQLQQVAAESIESPSPGRQDSPDEARGRRIVSTAFVMIGAGGRLRVDLSDGRTLELRDVTMGVENFCGLDATPGGKSRNVCGGYAEVVGAKAIG